MAKELNFTLGSKTYAAAPVKLDRKKMYGWTTKVAIDHTGKECDIAYLDTYDSQLLPSGAVKQGIVDNSGRDIAFSSTEEQIIRQIMANDIANNVKKGWQEIS